MLGGNRGTAPIIVSGEEMPEFSAARTVSSDGLAVSSGNILIDGLTLAMWAGPVEGLVAEEGEELPFCGLHCVLNSSVRRYPIELNMIAQRASPLSWV